MMTTFIYSLRMVNVFEADTIGAGLLNDWFYQIKAGRGGQVGPFASSYDQTQSIPQFQDESRDNPPCGDVARPVPTAAPECGGFAA